MGLCALTANGQVQFLLGELKSHKPSSVARYYLGGRKKIASGLDRGRTGEKLGRRQRAREAGFANLSGPWILRALLLSLALPHRGHLHSFTQSSALKQGQSTLASSFHPSVRKMPPYLPPESTPAKEKLGFQTIHCRPLLRPQPAQAHSSPLPSLDHWPGLKRPRISDIEATGL